MGSMTIDFAEERLIRSAPEHPLSLDAGDSAYVQARLAELSRQFGMGPVLDLPLEIVPARVLMRRLVELRKSLRPQTAEQECALGGLVCALGLLNTACAFSRDHQARRRERRTES